MSAISLLCQMLSKEIMNKEFFFVYCVYFPFPWNRPYAEMSQNFGHTEHTLSS